MRTLAAGAREDGLSPECEAAMAELIARHQMAVYGTIVKMLGDRTEAQDLAQQVFLRVYKAAPNYKPTAQFRTWLFTIVRNLVFNESRRRSRAKFLPLATGEPGREDRDDPHAAHQELPDPKMKTPGQEALDHEMIAAVDRAILALPEQQRLAVVLRRYDELSYDEIAEVMKTTVPSVKSLLFRARETLREALRAYLDE
ncbi:MAG: sigma-70 family RNA polymerase sigma factor [Verrucomicrobiota bacterium]